MATARCKCSVQHRQVQSPLPPPPPSGPRPSIVPALAWRRCQRWSPSTSTSHRLQILLQQGKLHTCVGQPVFTGHTAVLLQNNLHREGRQTAQRRHKEEAAPPSAGRSTGSWKHDGAEANEESRSTALPSHSAEDAWRDSPPCSPLGDWTSRETSEISSAAPQCRSQRQITEGSSVPLERYYASALPLTTALIIVDHRR